MNLAEMIEFVKLKGRINSTELNDLIKLDINRAYAQLARKRQFVELRVDDETFTTTANQRFYTAPYPITDISRDSVRYDVTSSSAGTIIRAIEGTEVQHYRAGAATTVRPQSISLTSGSGTALYATGTVAVSNRGTTVTLTGGTFSSSYAGEWIVFSTDTSGNNGGDYGYLIDSASGTTLTLATSYRGPDLSGARYSIRPAHGKRIVFDPEFTEDAKTVVYSWQRRPARLYNDEDTPEVVQLSEAICWKALAENSQYHRDGSYDVMNFKRESEQALRDALR